MNLNFFFQKEIQIVDKSLYLFRKDIGFLLYIGNFRNEIVFFCIF